MPKPPLKDRQAIIRTDTSFGLFDYFLIEAVKVYGVYVLKIGDGGNIDQEEWKDIDEILKSEFSLKGKKIKDRIELPGKDIDPNTWVEIQKALPIKPFPITGYKNEDSYRIKRMDISIDKWLPTIKELKIDYSDKKVTAYCNHGTSFKEMWEGIKSNYKVAV